MSGQTLDNIIDSLTNKGAGGETPPAGSKAPAFIGKAVFESDLTYCKFLGASTMAQVLGTKDGPSGDSFGTALNFGSKRSMMHMGDLIPEDVRFRLFNLKKMVNNLEIQAQIMFKGQHITPAMLETMPYYKNVLAPMLKAYNVTDFSTWIPTVNSRFYFEEFQLPFLLADDFDQMPMDSSTVNVPGDIGHLEGHEETDAATFTAQSTTQDNYVVNARNNVVHAQITEDLLADSAPAYIEKLRRDVVMGIARAYEKCIINGDTAGSPRGASHQDADTAALALNATFAKAFDGMRAKAFAAETAHVGGGGAAGAWVYDHNGDSASKAMFAQLMLMLGKQASEKDVLRYVVSSTVENQIVTGAIPELFTAFAFGGLASNVTGQCPPIFGAKVRTSQFVREDLAATGKYTTAGNTLTQVSLINVSRFSNFTRQAVRVWAAPSLPSSDIMLMTAKARHAWNGNKQTSLERSVVQAINVKTI